MAEASNKDISLRCDLRVACVLEVPKQSKHQVLTVCFDLGSAEGMYVGEACGGQSVKPHAVGVRVEDVVHRRSESEQVGVVGNDLEDGFLDTKPVAFAEFRNAAESAAAFGCGGVDVVGQEKVHHAAVQGR
ncbi:hypothetical protein [Streptomyces clavifer]